jgi:tetratricopeptide (TPR) repeat protein
VLVVVAVLALASASAQAASQDVGRAHARKANKLAASGKCKQAIPEFTKAYFILRDPALLFNRAECWRKVGQPGKALVDYRQFLAQLPEAPNRALVEQRIGELDPSAAPPPPVVEAKPPPEVKPPPPPVEAKPPVVAEPPPPPPEPPRPQIADTEAPPILKVVPRREEEPASSGGVPAWVWVGATVIALAVGGAAVWYFGRSRTDVPSTALGNFRF